MFQNVYSILAFIGIIVYFYLFYHASCALLHLIVLVTRLISQSIQLAETPFLSFISQ